MTNVVNFKPHGRVVMTPAFDAGGPGSNPGAAATILILPSRRDAWDEMPSDGTPYVAPESDPA